MLPSYPFHISTRGRWGGEYGVATRGYLVLPPIVSRFPAEGIVQEGSFLSALVDEQGEWIADTILPSDWRGVVDARFDLEGLLGSVVYRAVVDEYGELVATIMMSEEMSAVIDEIEQSADIVSSGIVGGVETEDDAATVQEMASLGVVTDKPGEGHC